MTSEYDYRVKFKDISIGASKKKRRGGKGAASEPETDTITCEHKGCDAPGDFKSPKHGGGFHNFCQRHAAEYNKSWNFFDGMTDSEAKAFSKSAAYGHRKTWKFGTGPVNEKSKLRSGDPRMWAGIHGADAAAIKSAQKKSGRTRLQVRALADLDLPETATALEIRERYSEYVKRFHPDVNGGDRSSEQKLASVIKAFKTLKAAGLTQEQ
ncbi:J domain-containing protein [Ponticaulis profundi]|uniref:J domain-containing protein n=1 Tax=Ponticaulis profundi TaxID=2665222 RepID=A0ABW1SA22_9PROT